MNTNVKIIDLKLGNKIDFKLVFSKQKVNLQTSISLCNFGKNNSVNLKLNLTTNEFTSFLNFGNNLIPSFLYNYQVLSDTENGEYIKVKDVFNNENYFYKTEANNYNYFSFKNESKIKTHISDSSFEHFLDESNSIIISKTGSLAFESYLITRFKDRNMYYLNDDGIFPFETAILNTRERVFFNKDASSNLIQSIDIYSASYTGNLYDKKDRIEFTYVDNKISKIKYFYLDGTIDTYYFAIENDYWKITHEESKRAMFFNFDENENVISFKEDFDYYERDEFYTIVNVAQNNTVVEYENGEFLYLHFNDEGNLDYLFNDKGMINFLESFRCKHDYLVLRKSNTLFLKNGETKYENLAPLSMFVFNNKWNFIKGDSSSSMVQTVNNNVEYFNVFNTSHLLTVTSADTDNSSKLVTEIAKNFSNKKLLLLGLIKAINPGSAAILTIRATPFYDNVVSNSVLEKVINLSVSEGYKYICEEFYFEENVNKLKIELLISSGQKITFSNLMLIEHPYGLTNFYDENNLIYKTINDYNTTYIKRYDYEIKGIDAKRGSIFFEEDEISNGNFITKTTLSKNFINKKEISNKNQVIKDEKIFEIPGKKEVLIYSYFYDMNSLVCNENQFNLLDTNYSYYLNTDLISMIDSFDFIHCFNYGNNYIFSWYVEKSDVSNIIYKTESINDHKGLLTETKEVSSNPYNFYYDNLNNLTDVTFQDENLFEESFVESEYFATNLLVYKVVNNFDYFLSYDENDNLICISDNESNSLFEFEYNYLNNLKRVSNNGSFNEEYNYDQDNNLIEINNGQFNVINSYENNNLLNTNYIYNNELLQKVHLLNANNKKSQLISELLTKLSENNRYVCLFDRTNIYNKTDNVQFDYVERYCQLIKNYYSKNDFLPVNFISENNRNHLVIEQKNLNFAKIFNDNPIYFSKRINNNGENVKGSIGFIYNSLIANTHSIVCISINKSFYIRLLAVNNSSGNKTLKIEVKNDSNLYKIFDTEVTIENTSINYFNINFILDSSKLLINFYSKDRTFTHTFNCGTTLIDFTDIEYYIIDDKTSNNSSEYLKISAVLADFGCNIPLNEVINHFNVALRILKIGEFYIDEDSYIVNKILSISSSSIPTGFTSLLFLNSLKDSNNNEPLNYHNLIDSICYDENLDVNCYYAYACGLNYDFNLQNCGTIAFKCRVVSVEKENQHILTLFNDNTFIKLLADTSGKLLLSFNGFNFELLNDFQVLNNEFSLILGYKIINNSLHFNVQINDSTPIVGELIDQTTTNINGSNLKIRFGKNHIDKIIYDIDSTAIKEPQNKFNGFISDFLYSNEEISNEIRISIFDYYKKIKTCTSIDVFDRNNEKILSYNMNKIFVKNYVYKSVLDTYITPFLEEENIYFNNREITPGGLIDRKYRYSYENSTNPQADYKNIYSYVEEINSYLIDADFHYIHEYEYYSDTNFIKKETIIKSDGCNGNDYNILNKREISYTYNGNNISNIKTKINDELVEDKNFVYEHHTNKLLYLNNKQFIYDGMFLKQIKNGNGLITEEFEYRGSKLISYKDNNSNINITFEYDNYGRRINKIDLYDESNSVYYFYENNKLIYEKHSNYSLMFLYENEDLIGFKLFDGNNTNLYFYIKNAFNDVVEILNENGNSLVHYTYDCFGKNIEIYDLTENNLGEINPFRYRGYYYDEETSLFSISSKYYSPELGRFIQPADVSTLNPSSINGLNLYIYANNNPVRIAYSSSNTGINGLSSGGMISSLGNSIPGSSSRISLPAIPWLAENATTIYGSVSSLVTGIPILSHYYKYASIINDEFKLYGISKWKTSLQLSNVSFKMGALDGALIGLNVLIDMYDSYQRGVSPEGILLGGALTAVSSVGMFYLNKGIMWVTTTIGTAICPGIGTAIGFTVGLVGSILVDIFLGGWIADWIDNNVK